MKKLKKEMENPPQLTKTKKQVPETKNTYQPIEGDIIKVTKQDDGRVYFASIVGTNSDVTDHIDLDIRKQSYEKGKNIIFENGEYQLVDKDYVPQIPENQIFDMSFVHNSYKYKPKKLFINELKWKYLIRNILKSKNIIMTGLSGSGKTISAFHAASTLKRKLFNIPLGSTQDPRAALIGNTFYNKEKGTFFNESTFVQAIQTENAVILLEELSRAHPEAWNILMPVLDKEQNFLKLDEAEGQPVIKVAKGVSFIATANVGSEYTSTRVFDRALSDRFTTIEMDVLNKDEEVELLTMLYPDINKKTIEALAKITHETRKDQESESPKLNTAISTRMSVEMGEIINDGFSLLEAMEVCVLPFYNLSGGAESEREYIMQLIQKHLPNDEDDKELVGDKNDERENENPFTTNN